MKFTENLEYELLKDKKIITNVKNKHYKRNNTDYEPLFLQYKKNQLDFLISFIKDFYKMFKKTRTYNNYKGKVYVDLNGNYYTREINNAILEMDFRNKDLLKKQYYDIIKVLESYFFQKYNII